MAFTESSTTPAARRTGFAAIGRVVNNAGNDARAQAAFTLASLPSSSPPPCPRSIERTLGSPGRCVPSFRSHNANSRGRSGGVGARLRYGTDPMPLRTSPQLAYASSTAADASSVSCAAPHGTISPLTGLQGALSPTEAPAAAREWTPSDLVLLRHSHGVKTRLLYTDGHIDTIVVRSATRSPAGRTRASYAAPRRRRRRRCVNDNGMGTSTLQLGASARERADPRSLSLGTGQCLLKSFAVAQTHQQAPPQLESLRPQWTGVAPSPGFSSHAAESGMTSPVGAKPSRQAPSFLTVPSATFEQPQQRHPSTVGVTFPLPSQEQRPLRSGDFSDDRKKGERDRKRDDARNERAVSGDTAAFCNVTARPPPALATVTSASSVDEAASSMAADDTNTVVAAMQRAVRAELAAERRAGERVFADRYARDISASPSLFSLRFPFRPLSELYAFAGRPDSDGAAPAGWRGGPNGEQPSASATGHQRAVSSAGSVECASENAPAYARLRQQQQTPEVLLPHAQITTPSGFTLPELLQERLLPRETPALQQRLSELSAVRGLIDACDSTACRFAVSFTWFVLLRCRKAHREQSLVDDFRRLARAFSYAFPHVTLDDVLPPLDVLEQLLVELLTCSRYSKEMQNTAATEASAAAAETAAGASRCADEQHTVSSMTMLKRTSGGAASVNDQKGSESHAPQVSRSALQTASRAPTEVAPTTAPSRIPLRLRLHEHRAYFPLLVRPAWSKLINTGAADHASSGVYEESAPRYTQQQQQQQQQLLHHPRRQEVQEVLPSADALAILCKVYQDLWLHHSEYVQLCLYEELLYKQLALQFGTFTMHLGQGAMSAEASAAAAATAPFSAGVSKGFQPSMPWRSSVVADASSNAGGEDMSDLRESRSGMPTSGSDLQASTNTVTATIKTTSAATPAVMDGVLDSLLLLIAHATYFNCVFCFPNDVYAGMFDEDFRADVMRWLFFCCHGVVLTHVHVRRWPTPVKSDYIDAQQKRKAVVELQLSTLGLLPAHAQQPIVAPRAVISSHPRGQVSSTAIADDWQRASLVITSEDGTVDAAGVAANSEARLAYQFDRYGRSAALRVADLERCMARLQRRHMASGPYGSHRMRGGSVSGRTPSSSRPSSSGSVKGAPSPCHMYANLSDMEVVTLSSRQRAHTTPVSPSADHHHAAACTQAEAAKSLPHKRASVASRAKLQVAEAGTSTATSTGEFSMAAAESSTLIPAVDARNSGSRCGPKQVVFIRSSAERRVQRPRRMPTLAAAATSHRDGENEARAQLRTSVTAAVGKSLVALAAELRSAGRKDAVGKTRWKTSSPPPVREENGHRASASPCTAKGGNRHFSDSAAAQNSSVLEADPPNSDSERQEIESRGHQRGSSAGSLLSSYPLSVCPSPVRDYWLSTLLRAPLWWTARTAPATLQQQSTQLVLWSSVPIGTDGEVMLQKDLCRLQLEPWQALFAVVVVPPISKDAQQAAHQIRAYGKTLPQQQARLYRMMKLQMLHHQHGQQCCSQEHSRVLPVLALAPPTVAVGSTEVSVLPIGRAVSASGTAELDEYTASLGAFANVLSSSSALLPLVPLSIPEDGAAPAASTTTSVLAAASAQTDSRLGRRGIGEVYQGCTSPFFKLCSSYFIPAPSRLAHSRSGKHARQQTQQQQMHRSLVGSSNGYPDSAEATMLAMAATPIPSIMWGTAPESNSVLPAFEQLNRCAPADEGPTLLSTAAATAHSTNVRPPRRQPSGVDTSSRIPSRGGRPCSHGDGGGHSNVGAIYTRNRAKQQGSAFAITAIPREEAKMRPRSLGPLKKEALRRRAQLLADMDTIGKRDRVARQHYIVQHLKLCNAMTYTQSEAMMRRYRAHSRLALERLNCGEVGDAAAVRAMADGTLDVNL
ncbi:hypothetical protein GH5_07541 [Leishmania sp. Ghana 2012 LV757]|uniref:hypothetical protein n=1 Tax=Leishmania sp. Ghana 2012 LV757 TaxID=2803181 RepID=UPI001B3FBAEE|nr:hypothetical protein GH5_07541 [Leishmania sp. Ghana 2012 LV757]